MDETEKKVVGYYEKHTCVRCGKDYDYKEVAKFGDGNSTYTLCDNCQEATTSPPPYF